MPNQNQDEHVAFIDHSRPGHPDPRFQPSKKSTADVTAKPARNQSQPKDSSVKKKAGSRKSDGAMPMAQISPPQTVVQVNIYRDIGGHYEYLLLKRIDHDDNFWQVVTEPVASSSTIADTMRQAIIDQTGIQAVKHLSREMYSYEWYASGKKGRDLVFAVEAPADTVVTPDKSHYDNFAWLPLTEAVQRLKWDGNKQALRELADRLRSKRAQTPVSSIPGVYEQYHGTPVNGGPVNNSQLIGKARADGGIRPITPATADKPAVSPKSSHNPYGNNVPKRLPDRPEDGPDGLVPRADDYDEDDNTATWFL